jgi:two-component system response regulator AlgR
MPGMDGLEAAMHMARLEHPPSIIFTTAYDDRALEAFEARAVDYLLKPVRAERLEEALRRAGAMTHGRAALLRHSDPVSHPRAYIGVTVQGGLELVPVAEIRYFRAEHKYVFAGREGREILLDESLKALEAEFAGRFLRIHRSALVARDFVERIERRADGLLQVRLRGVDEPLPVSRRHGSAVKKALRESTARR